MTGVPTADFGEIRALIRQLNAAGLRLNPFELVDTVRDVLRMVSTPPPGDPEALERTAGAFRAAGRDLVALADDLDGVARRSLPRRWRSPAGARAGAVVTATAHLLAVPGPTFDHVADALEGHAEYVRQLRRRHAELHEELRAALYDATHLSVRVEVFGIGFGFDAPVPDLTALAGLAVAVGRLVAGCIEIYDRSLWSAENLVRIFRDVAGNARARTGQRPGTTAADAVVAADRRRPTADRLRVFNLNIGQGFGNAPWDDRGTDPGDMGEIAQRIIDGDADVATLQEVFAKDLPELERELERRTGEPWNIHFGEASSKIQAATWWRGSEPFGNAVAVRLGDDVRSSGEAQVYKLDEPGDDHTEGRSALGVEVRTVHGGTVDVLTAHISHGGQATQEQISDQIGRLADAARSNPDPTVVTGDFNTVREGDNPPAAAVRRFDQYGYTDTGARDNLPTISHATETARIDYVLAGPGVGGGRADVVDGDPSDHDAVVVDVDVPARR